MLTYQAHFPNSFCSSSSWSQLVKWVQGQLHEYFDAKMLISCAFKNETPLPNTPALV